MTQVLKPEYVGVRARFYRLRDAKVFNGWIESSRGTELVVRVAGKPVVERGERFQFEIVCSDHTAHFVAALGSVVPSPTTAFGNDDGEGIALCLSAEAPIKSKPSTESFRMVVTTLMAEIVVAGKGEQARVIDVAKGGIGLATEQAYATGAAIDIVVVGQNSRVAASGTIRYCRPAKGNATGYRVGVQFTLMSRVDQSRWTRVLQDNGA